MQSMWKPREEKSAPAMIFAKMELQASHARLATLAAEQKKTNAWLLRESNEPGMLTIDVMGKGSARYAYTNTGWVFVNNANRDRVRANMIPLNKDAASSDAVLQLLETINKTTFAFDSGESGIEMSGQVFPATQKEATNNQFLTPYVQDLALAYVDSTQVRKVGLG